MSIVIINSIDPYFSKLAFNGYCISGNGKMQFNMLITKDIRL